MKQTDKLMCFSILIFMGLFFNSCERKPLKKSFHPCYSFSDEMRPSGDAIYNDNACSVKRVLTEQQISPDTVDDLLL